MAMGLPVGTDPMKKQTLAVSTGSGPKQVEGKSSLRTQRLLMVSYL